MSYNKEIFDELSAYVDKLSKIDKLLLNMDTINYTDAEPSSWSYYREIISFNPNDNIPKFGFETVAKYVSKEEMNKLLKEFVDKLKAKVEEKKQDIVKEINNYNIIKS